MHHPARVLEVLSPGRGEVEGADDTVQAVVEMWDKNVFTFDVEDHLKGKLKKKDIVLVDYRSVSEHTRIPRQVVIKILHGKTGQRVWKAYADFYASKNPAKAMAVPFPAPPRPPRPRL